MIDFAPNMNQLNQRAYLANRIKKGIAAKFLTGQGGENLSGRGDFENKKTSINQCASWCLKHL